MSDSQETDEDVTGDRLPEDRELDLAAHDTIEKWSAMIAFGVVELMQQWSKAIPFVIHVKSTQGTGKSLGDMETIPLHIGPTAVFGPRHEDVREDADEPALRSLYEVHFEGKDRSCIHPRYEGRHHRVHPDVSAEWCENCEFRTKCNYWDAYQAVNQQGFYTEPNHSDADFDDFQQNKSEYAEKMVRGYTAVHQHLPLHPTVLNQWDDIKAILIDESPWDAIAEKTAVISLDDVTEAKDATARLIEDDTQGDRFIALHDALVALERLIDPETDYDDTLDVFEQWESVYNQYEENNAIDTVTRLVSSERSELEENTNTRVIGPLLTAMPNIRRGWDRAIEADKTLVDQRPPKAFWRIDDTYLHLRWMDTEQLSEIAQNTPVAVLATEMPTAQVEAMFDLPVVTITDNLTPEVDVYQLDTRKAGITQLKKKQKLWDDLLELTELAVEREQLLGSKVFIAVKKELVEDVQGHLESQGFEEGEDFEIGNYYGLTGSNRFEDCDGVILFGKPSLRKEDAIYKSLVSGISKDVFHKTNTEGELRDALHRIRPAKKNGVRAYILTSVVDFEEEFTGGYKRDGTSDLKDRLTGDIQREKKRQEIRTRIIEFVQGYDGTPTATEITDTVSGPHSKIQRYRDELVEDGVLEVIKEAEGPGRPSKRYRVLDPLPN